MRHPAWPPVIKAIFGGHSKILRTVFWYTLADLSMPCMMGLSAGLSLEGGLGCALEYRGYECLQKDGADNWRTGQDGAYLAKLLLEKIIVLSERCVASTLNLPRLAVSNINGMELQTLDVQDLTSIVRMIETIQPDEIYNLSGQSLPQASFQQPLYTGETSGLGTLRWLSDPPNECQARFIKPPAVRFWPGGKGYAKRNN